MHLVYFIIFAIIYHGVLPGFRPFRRSVIGEPRVPNEERQAIIRQTLQNGMPIQDSSEETKVHTEGHVSFLYFILNML